MKKDIFIIMVFCALGFPRSMVEYFISGGLGAYEKEEVVGWLVWDRGFEPNLGQVVDFEGKGVEDVLLRARDNGFWIFVTNKGMSYVLYDSSAYARIDLELVGACIDKANVVYEDEVAGYTNYYLPCCPDGILGVKAYRTVRIRGVYPGVDWVFRYVGGRLHYEFELSAGADVGRIKMRVRYADLEVEDGKRLIFSTPLGRLVDGEVVGFSGGDGVLVSYEVEDGLIGFDVEGWSRRERLIIDPPLARLWATYYGGNNWESANSIATDSAGNIFVVGQTRSANFPTQNPGGGAYYQGTMAGSSSAFILKFNKFGVRQWATYYGGSNWDAGLSVTTDNSGNVFVTGYASSADFPTYNPGGGAYYQGTNQGWDDAFILKFSNSGVRMWATYYGGGQTDDAYAITTDNSDNIFVVGYTGSSANFPLYDPGGGAYYQSTFGGGTYDAFILKFSNSGVRQWATFYGGNGYDYIEFNSVAADRWNNIFITGRTTSTNLPLYDPGGGAYYQGTFAGQYDAFIFKFTNSGVRQWATYYGGNGSDYGYGVTTDSSGNILVSGTTYSTNFPVYDPGGSVYYQGTNAGSSDAFILKFDRSCARQWATYYGGSSGEYGYAITTDRFNNIFVAGWTYSANFPVYDHGGGAFYQGTKGYGCDGFILGFSASCKRGWATFYGADSTEQFNAIATDDSGNIFIPGITNSLSFPCYNPGGGAYYQGTIAGSYDAVILKFETCNGDMGIDEKNSGELTPQVWTLFFKNNLHLKFNREIRGIVEVKLFNAFGEAVYKKRLAVSGRDLMIGGERIKNLGSGVYFLSGIVDDKSIVNIKLIKL